MFTGVQSVVQKIVCDCMAYRLPRSRMNANSELGFPYDLGEPSLQYCNRLQP
jgi:hypothetical protein